MGKATAKKNQEKATRILQLFGEDGKHWAKGALAYKTLSGGRGKNEGAEYAEPRSKEAQSWCLIGACEKLGFSSNFLDGFVENEIGDSDIAEFNDADGWTPVKKLLQRIIQHGEPSQPKHGEE